MTISIIKKEYSIIMFSVCIFLVFPWISRYIDVTSASFDLGILSAILLSILALLSFKAVTWIVIKAIWPLFSFYSENQLERDFKILLPLEKVVIYLMFYLLLLLAFIITLVAFL